MVITIEQQFTAALAEVEKHRKALTDKDAAIAEKDGIIKNLQDKLF